MEQWRGGFDTNTCYLAADQERIRVYNEYLSRFREKGRPNDLYNIAIHAVFGAVVFFCRRLHVTPPHSSITFLSYHVKEHNILNLYSNTFLDKLYMDRVE